MDNGGTLHTQAFVRMEISKTRKREWLHSMFYSNVKEIKNMQLKNEVGINYLALEITPIFWEVWVEFFQPSFPLPAGSAIWHSSQTMSHLFATSGLSR